MNISKLLEKKPSFDDLFLFFLQLATFYQSGEPILRSIDLIAVDTENKVLKSALMDIQKNLRNGGELSKSFSKHPFFPGFCVHAVEAGEQSGKLEEAFFEVANEFEQAGDVRRMIQSSLLPVKIVLAFALVALTMAITSIIPKFIAIYKDLNLTLPLFTKIVITVIGFLLDYWFIHIFLIIGAYFYLRYFTQKYPEKIDAFLLKVPLYRSVYYYILQYRIAKVYSLLRNAGITPGVALEITADTVDNAILAKILRTAAGKIRNYGQDVPQALRLSNHDRLINPVLINFIATGEESGNIGVILERVAQYFKKMLQFKLIGFREKIGPLFLSPMMLFVVSIILAVLYPVLSLSNFGK